MKSAPREASNSLDRASSIEHVETPGYDLSTMLIIIFIADQVSLSSIFDSFSNNNNHNVDTASGKHRRSALSSIFAISRPEPVVKSQTTTDGRRRYTQRC